MERESRGVRYVGLIMEDIFTDFAKEVIRGVVTAAKGKENIRLILLVGRQNEVGVIEEKQHLYKNIYNTIYRLENVCRFDGLILTLPNTYAIENDTLELSRIKRLEKIPKVFIATKKQGETSVNYDNASGIREAIDYLVNTRGVKKICMLGGRDDNGDAMERKRVFKKCLEENQLHYDESLYQKTDMSSNCREDAAKLLDGNPDAQAIFCVNDPVAVSLYEELEARRIVPGRDILVFGFDNTKQASTLVPPLASIGPTEDTLGKKALDLLLDKMDGEEVESIVLPTSLYGRESCPYDKYEYTLRELINVDSAFIDRMFDDCFYRYKNEYFDSKAINLKRLFHEFISRMLYATKRRYMSTEEFEEIGKLIDVFFDNGVMDYTDATKFLQSIERLQSAINFIQRNASANVQNNRLFVRMKDRAIQALAGQRNRKTGYINSGRGQMQEFFVSTTDFDRSGSSTVENIIKHFDMLGVQNAALYLYETPVDYNLSGPTRFPDRINLRCVTKGGVLYVIPREQQDCSMENIFLKKEIPSKCQGFVPFPVFYGSRIYGIMLCELTDEIPDRGEYVATMLSRVLYVNDMEVINSPAETEKMREARRNKKNQEIYGQIAEGLASHYDIIYYVNSVNAKYMEFKGKSADGSLVVSVEGRDFFAETMKNAIKIVHPEDLNRITAALGKDHLITALEDRKQFQADYRVMRDGKPEYARLTVMWGSDRIHFIIGIENVNDEVQREEEHVKALQMANELARRDGLTGAKNINAYKEVEEALQRELEGNRGNMAFSIVVCDINNLKYVNDTFGHKAGDEYIKASCKLIFDTFSHSPVFRIGGDEFVVVMMGADYEKRDHLIRIMQDQVLHNQINDNGPVVAVGIATFRADLDNKVSEVFERADAEMYQNKNHLKRLKLLNEV